MKWIFFCLLTGIMLSCNGQPSADNQAREVVFKNVNVIPMDKEEVLMNQDVVTGNGKIIAMGPTTQVKYGNQAIVIDASGKYLLPGLAEMHAHVPPVDNLEPMKEVLMLFVLNGVTTIRGMLGHPRHLELRNKIDAGEITGPKFITSGPSFNGNSVKTPEAAREMVAAQKKAGYDFLKLHPGLTKQNFDTMATWAKKLEIPFAGHVSFNVGVWHAIESGYATIDHLDGFVECLVPGIENIKEQETGLFGMFIADKASEAGIQKLVDALREKNIWVVPTQALAERWFHPGKNPETLANEPEMKYMGATTLANWVNSKKNLMSNPQYKASTVTRLIEIRKKLIDACNKNGVGLLLGSDAPQVFDVPGFSIHHELRYLVEAGLTPYEAIKTGTVNVGRFLNQSSRGIIRTGAISDLLLLGANPLENIGHTTHIEGVMLGHHWFSKEDIHAELKKLEKPRN